MTTLYHKEKGFFGRTYTGQQKKHDSGTFKQISSNEWAVFQTKEADDQIMAVVEVVLIIKKLEP